MKDTANIEKMEHILNNTEELLENLKAIMEKMDKNLPDFKLLSDYYYSDERTKDLEDDQKGLFPGDLKRGVLSEDGIWNLSEDYQECALELMELGLRMLRNK